MSRDSWAIRLCLILMIISVSLVGTSASAQGATVVRVDPSASTAQVNNTVNLSIKVDNIANLTAFEVHLSFNPSVLEVVAITNGGFVVADFTAQSVFDNAAGTIDYAVAQMNRPAAQGSGTLLNISFRAKANGSSTVALRATQAVPGGLLLSDSNGAAIPASWVDGSVTVGSTAPTSTFTPTPTTTVATPIVPATSTNTSTPGVPASSTPTSAVPASATPTSVNPTATPLTPIPVGGTLGIHVVRFGEYLYCIGRAYGVSPYAIAKANGIWWPYIIFPGWRLIIPNVPWIPMPAGRVCQAQFSATIPIIIPTTNPTATNTPGSGVTPAVTSAPTATPTPVPWTSCRFYYVVRPGDTLYRIALWYGTTYQELARVNHIANPRLIYPGQQLCIP